MPCALNFWATMQLRSTNKTFDKSQMPAPYFERACDRNDSVYGAALALPQIARTAGWSLEYTSLACHSNLVLHLGASGFRVAFGFLRF